MKKREWDALMNHVNLGSRMAEQHDAAFVLVAVAEVEEEKSPLGTWVTSGIVDNDSVERSESMIAVLEHAVAELTKDHELRFGKKPQIRGYQMKSKR